MKAFNHRNVLSLIGVAIDDDGIPLIVVPFMQNGCLKKYIMTPSIEVKTTLCNQSPLGHDCYQQVLLYDCCW